jgi:hypothetical protein
MAKSELPLPRLGPYCAFTGRMVRPWPTRLLQALLHALVVLWLPLAAWFALGPRLGPGQALLIGAGVALVYLLCLLSARARFLAQILVAAGAVVATVFSWSQIHPLAGQAEGLPAWIVSLQAASSAADDFVLQAARIPAFALLSLLLALLLLMPILATAITAGKLANLPRRLWFARYHPVWARRYAPGESPHPLIGVLAVRQDPLLSEKLIWLKLPPKANAFALAPENAAPVGSAVPLAALSGPVAIFESQGSWYQSGQLGPANGALRLRLLAHELQLAASVEELELEFAPAAALPVRDFFAADNSVYGKTYVEEQDTRVLGLLLDSRPNLVGPEPALPRFTLLLTRVGQAQAEYPHPDLLGQPFLDAKEGRLHLPWRGAGEQVLDLDLPLGSDLVHAIETDGEPYFLLWVSFAENPRPLESLP